MRDQKHGLGLLGLLALVGLGAAVFASCAQALTPKFLIGKKAIVGTVNAPLEGKQVGRMTFLVPALNTEFNCEKFGIKGGLLINSTDAEGELLFEECTVLELKDPLREIECDVKSNKTIAATALILPTELANGEPAILVEKIKALVGLELPECPLPLDNFLKGELCLKIVGNDTVKPKVATSQAIQGECKERVNLEGLEGAGFKDKLLYGSQEAFLDATAEVFLGGPFVGKELGVSLQ